MHIQMGQHVMAVAALREADDLFREAERKGKVNRAGYTTWCKCICNLGHAYLNIHQSEPARRCFLRILVAYDFSKRSRKVRGVEMFHVVTT